MSTLAAHLATCSFAPPLHLIMPEGRVVDLHLKSVEVSAGNTMKLEGQTFLRAVPLQDELPVQVCT